MQTRPNREPAYLVPGIYAALTAVTTFVWVTGWPLSWQSYSPGLDGAYERAMIGLQFMEMQCLCASPIAYLLKRRKLAYGCLWAVAAGLVLRTVLTFLMR